MGASMVGFQGICQLVKYRQKHLHCDDLLQLWPTELASLFALTAYLGFVHAYNFCRQLNNCGPSEICVHSCFCSCGSKRTQMFEVCPPPCLKDVLCAPSFTFTFYFTFANSWQRTYQKFLMHCIVTNPFTSSQSWTLQNSTVLLQCFVRAVIFSCPPRPFFVTMCCSFPLKLPIKKIGKVHQVFSDLGVWTLRCSHCGAFREACTNRSHAAAAHGKRVFPGWCNYWTAWNNVHSRLGGICSCTANNTGADNLNKACLQWRVVLFVEDKTDKLRSSSGWSGCSCVKYSCNSDQPSSKYGNKTSTVSLRTVS